MTSQEPAQENSMIFEGVRWNLGVSYSVLKTYFFQQHMDASYKEFFRFVERFSVARHKAMMKAIGVNPNKVKPPTLSKSTVSLTFKQTFGEYT